jgi:hypothetical protein
MNQISSRVFIKTVFAFLLICISLLPYACSSDDNNNPEEEQFPDVFPEAVERYNYIVGTQTIGVTYQFTQDSKLIETAKQIRLMGSNILKISLAFDVYDLPAQSLNFSHEVFEKDASFKEVLSMDFRYYLFWVYAPKVRTSFLNGLSELESQNEYENMYTLADYLLKNCTGSEKEFYIGNWEGDWHLTGSNANLQTVSPERIQGMTDWLNIRQKAIEDAKAANPGSDVKIYHYCEVNLVIGAMRSGFDRVVNKVLPNTNVDFVSYSSYDVLGSSTDYELLERDMHLSLNYIEQNMKPKAGITGKRAFIGEYAFPSRAFGVQAQDIRTRMVMKAGLKWGCPFILYWEMYNNEVDAQGHTGNWLIDDKGAKQPAYYTHRNFCTAMKKYVYKYNKENGHLPSREEYLLNAVKFFE